MSRIIPIIIGVLLCATLTGLAIYAAVHASQLSLPTPLLSHILSIILPFATFSAIGPYLLQRKPVVSFPFALSALAILDTILVTLSGADIRPQSLSCYLAQQWQHLFSIKDARSIRRIQDSLDCCGYRTPRHQAFPFYNREEGTSASACVVQYGRHTACQNGWMREERKVLGLMVGIAACGLVVKLLLLLLMRWRPEWVRGENVATLHRGEHQRRVEDGFEPRVGGRYLDNPVIEEENVPDSLERTNTRNNPRGR